MIAAEIIKAAVRDRKSVLVLAHRREIVGQTSSKLRDFEILTASSWRAPSPGRWRWCRSRLCRR